jgi:hypothetical protein
MKGLVHEIETLLCRMGKAIRTSHQRSILKIKKPVEVLTYTLKYSLSIYLRPTS